MPRKALWFFHRTAPGQIRRISNPSVRRFLVGERPLPHDGDGFVRCIGMSLELRGKKLSQVKRLWFSKIRVREDGHVDPHHRHETVRLARSEAQQAAESSVVVAGHRFAMRRLSHLGEWRPEESDLTALRAVVNTRAGKEML